MGARTSQLQIRVTPAEKATLKRLAEAAGETLSSYVLTKALPPVGVELTTLVRRLSEPDVDTTALVVDLAAALVDVPPDALAESVPAPDFDAVPPVLLNRVAALVESDATRRGGVAPSWTRRVPPLSRPHFAWSLTSLKPHQMRVTPVAFKRRNLFYDPTDAPTPALAALRMSDVPEGTPSGPSRELSLFALLEAELTSTNTEVEFYFLGGALLFQAFSAAPPTVNVSALFQPASPVHAAIEAVAEAEGVDRTWPHDCASAILREGRDGAGWPFLELTHVRVFDPRPEYVLALKCAALRLGEDSAATDDLRYVLRAMNVTTADVALSLVERYFAERQLAPDTRARLEALLPS